MTEQSRLEILDFKLYVSCFYKNNSDFNGIFDLLKSKIIEKTKYKKPKISLKKLGDFKYKKYDTLGVLEIAIGSVDTEQEPKPKDPFRLSQLVKGTLMAFNENKSYLIYFDDLNLHPYAYIHASRLHPHERIEWTPEMIDRYKKVLGPWIEYYSGQWEDYSEELYNERVSHNLSNRLSELHYIRSNSCFVFLPTYSSRWKEFMGYMKDNFLMPILLSRGILFSLLKINDELDQLAVRLRDMDENASLKMVEGDLKKIDDMYLSIMEISTRLEREKLMNRLHHGTKVIRECFRVFSLEDAHSVISNKAERLHNSLQSLQEKVKLKVQNQQKKWVLILNALIGSQVLFTIRDNLNQLAFIKDNHLESFVSLTVWILFVILLVISVGGLAFNYLKQKTEFLR